MLRIVVKLGSTRHERHASWSLGPTISLRKGKEKILNHVQIVYRLKTGN
jgi:hypothetical protein